MIIELVINQYERCECWENTEEGSCRTAIAIAFYIHFAKNFSNALCDSAPTISELQRGCEYLFGKNIVPTKRRLAAALLDDAPHRSVVEAQRQALFAVRRRDISRTELKQILPSMTVH